MAALVDAFLPVPTFLTICFTLHWRQSGSNWGQRWSDPWRWMHILFTIYLFVHVYYMWVTIIGAAIYYCFSVTYFISLCSLCSHPVLGVEHNKPSLVCHIINIRVSCSIVLVLTYGRVAAHCSCCPSVKLDLYFFEHHKPLLVCHMVNILCRLLHHTCTYIWTCDCSLFLLFKCEAGSLIFWAP